MIFELILVLLSNIMQGRSPHAASTWSATGQEPHFIAIAGNIGSGKSSLTALLSQKFGWKPAYEVVDTNPYLADFYKEMSRWSFQLQMFFLITRFKNQRELMRSPFSIIQDRTIFEDGEIFARNLFLQGLMEERDYRTYLSHFETLTEYLRAPDVLIYLRADVPTLARRIEQRGREYEKRISIEYLTQLNRTYEDWVASYKRGPVVVVDTSKQDFVHVPRHLEQVASVVAWELECMKNRSQKTLPLSKASKDRPVRAPELSL